MGLPGRCDRAWPLWSEDSWWESAGWTFQSTSAEGLELVPDPGWQSCPWSPHRSASVSCWTAAADTSENFRKSLNQELGKIRLSMETIWVQSLNWYYFTPTVHLNSLVSGLLESVSPCHKVIPLSGYHSKMFHLKCADADDVLSLARGFRRARRFHSFIGRLTLPADVVENCFQIGGAIGRLQCQHTARVFALQLRSIHILNR